MQKTLFSSYFEMTKPRITTLVLVTAALGYALALDGAAPFLGWRLVLTLVGTGLASGGASVLNHYAERDADALMHRTRNRPLPTGAVPPWAALLFGIALMLGGSVQLWVCVNPLSAALALATALLYVLVYTPMKRFSWMNTPVGAVPGAIPPMIGWAGATGSVDLGAWVLFFVLFLWQHPHFYAIAWMFKDDYARGGFKMLPNVDPDGHRTFRLSLASAGLLIPVSLCLVVAQRLGWIYGIGALLSGLWYFWTCVRWRRSGSAPDARRVLRVSVIYLPLLFVLMLVDLSL